MLLIKRKKMKKKLLLASYLLTQFLNLNAMHYVFNLTGKTLQFNFYAKDPFTGKTKLFNSQILGPIILAGKSPDNFIETISTSMLPKKINMNPVTCFKVTIHVLDMKNSKFKIKSLSMPTPGTSLSQPADFSIELKDKQLIAKQLTTSGGIPILGAKKSALKQWPSDRELARQKMSPQERIDDISEENKKIEARLEQLKKEIQKMHDKRGNIKFGMLTKVNNRHKMVQNKKDKLKANQKEIAKLQAQINNTTNTKTLASDTIQPQTPVAVQDTTPTPTNNIAHGGTVSYNPATGTYTSAPCKNGICPLGKILTPAQ